MITRDRCLTPWRHFLRAALVIALPWSGAAAQRIDTTVAMTALREADAACHRDAGALWGRSLCGPIALAERQTRLVLTNDSAVKQPFTAPAEAP